MKASLKQISIQMIDNRKGRERELVGEKEKEKERERERERERVKEDAEWRRVADRIDRSETFLNSRKRRERDPKSGSSRPSLSKMTCEHWCLHTWA